MPQWPNQVRPIAASGLPEVLAASRLVGIHFWASWNGHDHQFARELGRLLEGAGGGMDVYAMDVDDESNAPFLAEWTILNVPAFVVFHQGRRLRTFYQGRESAGELRERIQHWLRVIQECADQQVRPEKEQQW
jgi:thioredoxin-like negative regulator of GroEL